MPSPRENIESDLQDDLSDVPEDLVEQVEEGESEDADWGDETQRNEERTAEEGLEQDHMIDPRGEDDE